MSYDFSDILIIHRPLKVMARAYPHTVPDCDVSNWTVYEFCECFKHGTGWYVEVFP